MFVDAIHSHYEYVRARILAASGNPTNNPPIVGGILNAQDWPTKPFKFDCFYLLVLGEAPVGREGYSQYSPMVFHQVQWVWIDKGTDLVAGVRQVNRGNRFQTMQLMKQYLLQALVPGYAFKYTWSLVNGEFTSSPTSTPGESITWNPVSFHEKFDKDSGLQYGAGALRIWDITDAVTA